MSSDADETPATRAARSPRIVASPPFGQPIIGSFRNSSTWSLYPPFRTGLPTDNHGRTSRPRRRCRGAALEARGRGQRRPRGRLHACTPQGARGRGPRRRRAPRGGRDPRAARARARARVARVAGDAGEEARAGGQRQRQRRGRGGAPRRGPRRDAARRGRGAVQGQGLRRRRQGLGQGREAPQGRAPARREAQRPVAATMFERFGAGKRRDLVDVALGRRSCCRTSPPRSSPRTSSSPRRTTRPSPSRPTCAGGRATGTGARRC